MMRALASKLNEVCLGSEIRINHSLLNMYMNILQGMIMVRPMIGSGEPTFLKI
jgi:hypothetical protein